jgi:hypothetical protein
VNIYSKTLWNISNTAYFCMVTSVRNRIHIFSLKCSVKVLLQS